MSGSGRGNEIIGADPGHHQSGSPVLSARSCGSLQGTTASIALAGRTTPQIAHASSQAKAITAEIYSAQTQETNVSEKPEIEIANWAC